MINCNFNFKHNYKILITNFKTNHLRVSNNFKTNESQIMFRAKRDCFKKSPKQPKCKSWSKKDPVVATVTKPNQWNQVSNSSKKKKTHTTNKWSTSSFIPQPLDHKFKQFKLVITH